MVDYHEYTGKKVSLDDKDKAILECLNEDCRMPLTAISKRTAIPVDTIKYRIDKMRRERVFKYAVILDPNKLGYPIFNVVYLKLVHFTKKAEDQLVAYIAQHNSLVYSAKLLGRYDFAVGIASRDAQEFMKTLDELKTRFETNIKEYETFMVLSEHKFDDLTGLIG